MLGLSYSSSSLPMETFPVAPPPSQSVSVSHRGASIVADAVTTHGTYGDGSPWAVRTGATQVTASTPASATISGTLNGEVYTDGVVHGLMADPGQATNPAAPLADLQTNNQRRARNQGWDGRLVPGMSAETTPYDPAQNLDPGAAGQPLTIAKNCSLVKAISNTSATDQRDVITNFAVFTFLSSAPPHSDSCRPALALTDKTSRWRTSDIQLPPPSSVTLPDVPTYAALHMWISTTLHHMHDTDNTASRNIHNGYEQGYWGGVAEKVGEAYLWLIVGGGSLAERTEIARLLAQAAEDVRGRVLQGAIFKSNGGWCQLADAVLLGANELLPGLFTDAIDTVVETSARAVADYPSPGRRVLAETTRVEPVTQAMIDLDLANNSAPYPQFMLGWPEWNGSFGTNKGLPGEANAHNSLGNTHPLEPGASSTTIEKPTYRHTAMKAMVPLTLFLRQVGSGFIATEQTYFNYIDRHMSVIYERYLSGDYADLSGYDGISTQSLKPWIVEAWFELRNVYDIWAGSAVFSLIGQSETAIGVISNIGNNSRVAQYPTLLSGVNAKYAIKDRHDDKGTGHQIVDVNADTITAQEVNPGFVAMANLWHLGSGGAPLRVIDNVQSGTNMTQMMDDDDPARDFDEGVASVHLGSIGFGSVTDAVYNWWNSEAGASQTFWESRRTHFFGIVDGGGDYDFDSGTLEHCLIDTTGRGYGLLPADTAVHLMMPGVSVRGETGTPNPPRTNYTTDNTGGETQDNAWQNRAPAYQERIDFLADAPAANTGRALIHPAAVRFGDFTGGSQLSQPAETEIHPSILERDGQILFAQDVTAGLLIAKGYLDAPAFDRVEWSTDGAYADLVYAIPDGATLTTQFIQDGLTQASPRPHEQDVMGVVIKRSGDTDRTSRPVYRTDITDDALYPPAYRGTVTISDTGTGSGGAREAVVRVTPSQPFANGDAIVMAENGNYGEFNLHGYADYDARLYRRALRAYLPSLEGGSETYPGIPVNTQFSVTASGITAPTGPTTTFADSAQTQDFSSADWRANQGLIRNVVSGWLVKPTFGYLRADTADTLPAPSASTVVTVCYDAHLSGSAPAGQHTMYARLIENTNTSFIGEFGITLPAGTAVSNVFTDSGIIDMGNGVWRCWGKMPAASVASGDRVIYDIPSSGTASARQFNISQPALFYADLTPTEIENLGPALPLP